MPWQARERRIVIEIDRNGLRGSRGHDRADIGREPVVGDALVVERRQHQRAAEAELGGVPRERDRVGDGRGAGADHQPVERQAGLRIGGHHLLPLRERERGGLAGGAEHVEAVAAVVEQIARELGGARAIGLAVLIDRCRDRRDDATEGGLRHHALLGLRAQPLTLKAARPAMLTRSLSVADRPTICTGRSSPTSSGPITVAPPSSCSILVEIAAEWSAGMTSTLAGPDRRENG